MLPSKPSFHVSPLTGKPGRCRAHLHQCPFGAEDYHFESNEEARSFYEDYASKLTDSKQSVEFYFITDHDESNFIEGDCGFLARALHKETGYPMVFVGSGALENDYDHMAVRAPDGRIIDAVGMFTEADFKDTWGGKKVQITEISAEQWEEKHNTRKQISDSSPTKIAKSIIKSLSALGVHAK